MRLEVPEVLKRQHRELHLQLESATLFQNAVGDAARQLVSLLHDHLRREEEIAFPLLGLLPHLVEGRVGEEMSVALPLAGRLRRELGRLRRDHVQIVEAVEALAEAARKERLDDYTRLAYDLLEHARFEEAILYPAALIVGEYVGLRLKEMDVKSKS